MKRVILSLLLAGAMLFTSACGSSKPSTSKASQLSSQYAFYETSANSISSSMKITPEQADDVFLALVKCGLNDKITSVLDGTNSLYHVWSGAKSFDVQMKDGVVDTVQSGGKVLYPASKVDSSSSAASEPAKSLSLEEAVDKAIEKAHADKDKVSIVENVGTKSADDRNIEIYLKGKDNLSTKMIRGGMLIQANDILKELQPRPEIAQMCLFWSFPLTDSYGNTKEETVMKILIKKETLDKINFDNFDWNKIPEIADDYNEHSALTAK